jgi:hypothetical protein
MKREVEEKQKTIELEMARKIDEERGRIETSVLMRFEEQHKFKDAEKVRNYLTL